MYRHIKSDIVTHFNSTEGSKSLMHTITPIFQLTLSK